jgi:hypothetical protein
MPDAPGCLVPQSAVNDVWKQVSEEEESWTVSANSFFTSQPSSFKVTNIIFSMDDFRLRVTVQSTMQATKRDVACDFSRSATAVRVLVKGVVDSIKVSLFDLACTGGLSADVQFTVAGSVAPTDVWLYDASRSARVCPLSVLRLTVDMDNEKIATLGAMSIEAVALRSNRTSFGAWTHVEELTYDATTGTEIASAFALPSYWSTLGMNHGSKCQSENGCIVAAYCHGVILTDIDMENLLVTQEISGCQNVDPNGLLNQVATVGTGLDFVLLSSSRTKYHVLRQAKSVNGDWSVAVLAVVNIGLGLPRVAAAGRFIHADKAAIKVWDIFPLDAAEPTVPTERTAPIAGHRTVIIDRIDRTNPKLRCDGCFGTVKPTSDPVMLSVLGNGTTTPVN